MLESSQARSLTALREAHAAQADAARAVGATPTGTLPPDATPEQQAERTSAERRASVAADDASDRLRDARTMLEQAEDERDSAARRAAAGIREVIDNDGLKDSRWEKFKNYVSEHKDVIDWIAEKASWVATGLMVVSLFIPGINLITYAAIALTLVALAGHSALAASGEGSWGDAAFDVFALATFGAGRLLAGGAKTAQGVSRAAGGRAASKAATSRALASSSARRTAAGRVLSSRSASSGAKQAARAEIQTLKTVARRAGNAERRTVVNATLPKANPIQRLLLGGSEDEIARAVLDARSVAARFGADARAASEASSALTAANRVRMAYGAGVVSDLADKAHLADGLKAQPFFQRELGSQW